MRKAVSVVRLRHEGVKLAPEVVRLSALVRGQLSLSRALSGGEVANFYDPVKSIALFPRMIEALITKKHADGSSSLAWKRSSEAAKCCAFPKLGDAGRCRWLNSHPSSAA